MGLCVGVVVCNMDLQSVANMKIEESSDNNWSTTEKRLSERDTLSNVNVIMILNLKWDCLLVLSDVFRYITIFSLTCHQFKIQDIGAKREC